ncbi:hypothetical protein NE237_025047 [Protea cynaroides]|uniref:Uncharacterized protein n=1 Tax=Protea cynaroides TaxID=273540 RepID=A0A9Q0H138_9MAGN|nr:hypothetical protein NE237_025047 [Protea cynaroides]
MWFANTNCPSSSTTVSSASLTPSSFWVLFLITGVASLLALLAFLINFCWTHKRIWRNFDPELTLGDKIGIIAKRFDDKDYTCFTFRDLEPRNQNTTDATGVAGVPMSPTIISQRTTGNYVLSDDQATTSTGTSRPSPINPISEEISNTTGQSEEIPTPIELSNQDIIRPRSPEERFV